MSARFIDYVREKPSEDRPTKSAKVDYEKDKSSENEPKNNPKSKDQNYGCPGIGTHLEGYQTDFLCFVLWILMMFYNFTNIFPLKAHTPQSAQRIGLIPWNWR